MWTDTPADRLRKQQVKNHFYSEILAGVTVVLQEFAEGKVKGEKKDKTPKFVSERDEKLAVKVEEYNVSN